MEYVKLGNNSLGSSGEILGRALKDFAKREEVVIVSKLYFSMHEGPNAKGLSRKNIFTEIDKTLERLQTNYLDLYIIHRWDYNTPIEETNKRMGTICFNARLVQFFIS